jgi:hypothetical protein
MIGLRVVMDPDVGEVVAENRCKPPFSCTIQRRPLGGVCQCVASGSRRQLTRALDAGPVLPCAPGSPIAHRSPLACRRETESCSMMCAAALGASRWRTEVATSFENVILAATPPCFYPSQPCSSDSVSVFSSLEYSARAARSTVPIRTGVPASAARNAAFMAMLRMLPPETLSCARRS